MKEEILKFCLERGVLVDSNLLKLFSETSDIESVKLIIERVKTYTTQRVLTKNLFEQKKKEVNDLFFGLPEKNQKEMEKLIIKLGLSIEISKETTVLQNRDAQNKFSEEIKEGLLKNTGESVRVLSSPSKFKKKIEVLDYN